MSTRYKTHIEVAISLWKRLLEYDFEVYENVVKETFISHHIISKNQIEAFWKLLEISSANTDGNTFISYYRDNDTWCFKLVSKPYDVYLDNVGKRWYYDNSLNKTLSVFSTEISQEVNSFLDSQNISSGMKEIMTRPLRVLRMCESIFPENDGITQTGDWHSDFLASLNEEASRRDKLVFIIQLALLYGEKQDHVQDILSDICQEFFYHITKSLLNAEYLILDNYTPFLDEVINGKTSPPHDDDHTGLILPWFVKSFLVLVLYEKEMCLRINKIIREEGNYRVAIDYRADEFVENRFSMSYFVYGETSQIYENFVHSVIEMTTIDHLNKVNSKHIESLLLLWRRSDFIKQSVDNDDFFKVVNMVRIKTASILSTMLKQPKHKQAGHQLYEFYLSMGEKHMEDIEIELYEQSNNISYAKNPYISNRQVYKNVMFPTNVVDEKKEPKWSGANKDLKAYDSWAKKGRHIYTEASSIIEKVCDGKNRIVTIDKSEIDGILSCVENYSNSSMQKTSPFYQKSIEFLDAVMEETRFRDEMSIPKRVLNLLSKLLTESREFNAHLNNSQVPYYLPPFNTCFYNYNEGKAECEEVSDEGIRKYKFEDFSDKFFYASLGSPLSNPYLYNRTVEYYSNKLLVWVYDFTRRVDDNTYKEFRKKEASINLQAKEIENTRSDLRNENLHTRNHTVQLVGMFAIFMAFITSVIGSIRVAKNIPEFIVFSLTFLAGVTLFSILIKDFGNKKLSEDDKMVQEEKTKKKNNWVDEIDEKENESKPTIKDNRTNWWILGIIVLLIIVVSSIYPIYQKQQDDELNKETFENKPSNCIEIENNAIVFPINDTVKPHS
jgi:hypothetical protein